MKRALAFSFTLAALGCVGPQDDPSQVFDLRVLAVQVEPPEILAPTCDQSSPAAIAGLARTVQLTALLADPAGAGRDLFYRVRACAQVSDRTCDVEEDRVELGQGRTPPGALSLPLNGLGLTPLPGQGPDGAALPLLQRVLEKDQYKGLGGLRVPLALYVKAGEENVHAQKLMVYSCKLLPEMTANVTPQLPGITMNGAEWTDATPFELQGAGPFELEPLPFAHLQEPYVVPSFELQPVQLEERWKLSWHATLGRFTPNQTGGEDLGGQESRHQVQWMPPAGAVEQDVTFWVVVRDGRGGTSWLTRHARYRP